MILSGNEDVESVYREYSESGTELTLSTSLIRLIRCESMNVKTQGIVRVRGVTVSRVVRKTKGEIYR